MNEEQRLLRIIQLTLVSIAAIAIFLALGATVLINPSLLHFFERKENVDAAKSDSLPVWTAPDSTLIAQSPEGDMVRYGRELVARTSLYLGPRGKVKAISNGMNCQNCHLKAGKKIFGNNYSAVASTYPKFRARSGGIESIEKRVNDCIERSLNGHALEEESREMRAFVTYITWVGKDVPKGVSPPGSGLLDLPPLERPADSARGKAVYKVHCIRCHGEGNEGVASENGVEWKYPPLWGDRSYNIGAGLYRLSRLAGYVKANMPQGATYDTPVLTDEEAWDVSAYINAMPRPTKDLTMDWPDISLKPFDHPFGPFADNFSQEQHKYGPFAPIRELQKKK